MNHPTARHCANGHPMGQADHFCAECGAPVDAHHDHSGAVLSASPDLPPDFGRGVTAPAPGNTALVARPLGTTSQVVTQPTGPRWPWILAGSVLGFALLLGLLYATVTFAVPDVRGLALEVAEARISAQHLSIGTVSRARSDEVGVGEVIEQSDQGRRLRYGSPVALVVSEGPLLHDVTVTMTVFGSDYSYYDDGTCGSGLTGYWDIAEGTTVVVEGDAGQTLGIGSLTADNYFGTSTCSYSATVTDVPGDQAYYSITMGGLSRGSLEYSHAEMDAAGWSADLSLGN